MTISVIIPVYQAEHFIAKAIKSACEQKEVSEVIIVEDGSTDNSLRICEQHTQLYPHQVRLYRHFDCKNHGRSASRNLGISKATNKFISFLDADDYYLPNRFECDLNILLNNPKIDGVYNALGVFIYDESERSRIHSDLTTVSYPIPPDRLFEEMTPIGKAGWFQCDCLTVRRTVFNKVGLFHESLVLTQDIHMWIRMAAKITLVSGIIDRPVAIRGVHTENSKSDKNRVKRKYYRTLMFQLLLEWANENNISAERKSLIWKCAYKDFIKNLMASNRNVFERKTRILFFLVRHGVSNPYLLMNRYYQLSYFRDVL